jgi:hypothetical protein
MTLAEHPGTPRHITPAKKKKGGSADQYMSQFYGSDILEFDYPKGDSSTGTISGIEDAQGECTNGKGDWWVVASGSDEVDEFKDGSSSPSGELSVTAGEPAGCSVDTAGDVAVSILDEGDIVVFKGGKGSGTEISDGLEETYFIGYDSKGDIFVDGFNDSGDVAFAELAKGGKSFTQLTTSNSIEFPGQVQWDGKYITINDQEAHYIYQYTIKGSKATEKGSTELSGSSDCVQTWIAGSLVFCPDAGNEDGEVYNYPKGGNAVATLTGDFDLPIGAVQISGKSKKK